MTEIPHISQLSQDKIQNSHNNNTTEIRPISQLLTDFSDSLTGETATMAEILEAFHERGFGAALFIIALPAALPFPALGINMIIALPLLFITAQQMVGRHTVWLPEKLKGRTVGAQSLKGMIGKSMPIMKALEVLVRPRLGFLTQGIFSTMIGLFGFLMAISVAIPLPLTNTVPSMGIALMALGVLMRDGLAVLAGAALGIGWIVMLLAVIIFFGIEGIDLVKETVKSIL